MRSATVAEVTALHALRRAERSSWRAIVQFLPHSVLVLDAEQHVALANKAASMLFGVPAAALRGLPVTLLVPQHNFDRWLESFHGQHTKVLETSVNLLRSGAPRVTLKIIAVRMTRPRKHSLLVMEDITERAHLEEQLVESEKQAAMGQLAAGILHEVANPIASLGSNLIFVRSCLDDLPHEELRQAVDISLEQLGHMRQLLGTLSGFPGHQRLACERADLHAVLRRSVTFVTNEARRRRVRLDLHLAPTPLVCEFDPRLIRQVLLNVLKNAMEALPDGGRIEVRTRRRGREGALSAGAVIQVSDNGIGIPEADLRKVFRPLFSTKPRGVGLGLSFCRQAVEEHGGQIRLTSRGVNQGTVTTIALPGRQSSACFED